MPEGHKSDCATHNEPYMANGPRDCGFDTALVGKFVGFVNFYGLNDKAREWGLPDD